MLIVENLKTADEKVLTTQNSTTQDNSRCSHFELFSSSFFFFNMVVIRIYKQFYVLPLVFSFIEV